MATGEGSEPRRDFFLRRNRLLDHRHKVPVASISGNLHDSLSFCLARSLVREELTFP